MTKTSTTADVFDAVRNDGETSPDAPAAETPAPADESDTVNDTATTEQRRRTARWSTRTAVPLLLTAVALGTSIYLGYHAFRQHEIEQSAAAALQTARDYAVILTTLDSEHIDDTYNRTLDGATGEFKDAYSQGATQLRQILIDNKASGTGVVVDAAVKSAARDRVEVLMFVDQSITNLANSSPRIDRNRIDMTMERHDGRWLASKVDIV